MRSERLKRRVYRRKTLQGFTLMELMTVVIIVGVLSAIAVPTFSSYIYKSRTSEATEFLGVIRLREESYRSEFGVYCPTLASGATSYSALDTNSNLVPDPSTTKRDAKAFVVTSPSPWLQLGARPAGPVRFGYGAIAGTPADAVALNLGWTDATADFWFVARAKGDLNGDGNYCTFEIYSASKNVFINDPKGRGWD
jgi:prepilin-type N-terminal cleavage/methylation domain-containing protein